MRNLKPWMSSNWPWIIVGAFLLSIPAAIAVPAFLVSPASADNGGGPIRDKDVLSSVVRIEIDGEFAGTGVAVTRGGLVVTSYAIAQKQLQEKKRIVIMSDLPKAATLISFDAENGIALFQMNGVIPRPATIAAPNVNVQHGDVYVCRTQDGSVRQLTNTKLMAVVDLNHLVGTQNGACAVFAKKSGKLKALLTVTDDDVGVSVKTVEVSTVRALLGEAAPR